jgi:hypothetical protein
MKISTGFSLTVDQFLNSQLIQAEGREALPSRLFPAGEEN